MVEKRRPSSNSDKGVNRTNDSDDAMDVDPPANPDTGNVSSISPPQPNALQRPSTRSAHYWVVWTGTTVGVYSDESKFSNLDLRGVRAFAMERFDTWEEATAFWLGVFILAVVRIVDADSGHVAAGMPAPAFRAPPPRHPAPFNAPFPFGFKTNPLGFAIPPGSVPPRASDRRNHSAADSSSSEQSHPIRQAGGSAAIAAAAATASTPSTASALACVARRTGRTAHANNSTLSQAQPTPGQQTNPIYVSSNYPHPTPSRPQRDDQIDTPPVVESASAPVPACNRQHSTARQNSTVVSTSQVHTQGQKNPKIRRRDPHSDDDMDPLDYPLDYDPSLLHYLREKSISSRIRKKRVPCSGTGESGASQGSGPAAGRQGSGRDTAPVSRTSASLISSTKQQAKNPGTANSNSVHGPSSILDGTALAHSNISTSSPICCMPNASSDFSSAGVPTEQTADPFIISDSSSSDCDIIPVSKAFYSKFAPPRPKRNAPVKCQNPTGSKTNQGGKNVSFTLPAVGTSFDLPAAGTSCASGSSLMQTPTPSTNIPPASGLATPFVTPISDRAPRTEETATRRGTPFPTPLAFKRGTTTVDPRTPQTAPLRNLRTNPINSEPGSDDLLALLAEATATPQPVSVSSSTGVPATSTNTVTSSALAASAINTTASNPSLSTTAANASASSSTTLDLSQPFTPSPADMYADDSETEYAATEYSTTDLDRIFKDI